MSEKTLREMLGGLGYTDKDSESTGKHYGMGSKTGLMRMSPQGVLVFTVKDGNWAVGLLSTTLSEELGLSQECVFFCSWDAATRERVTTTTPNNPLSAEAREQSLQVILKKTCFTSEAALFRHFQLIEARHASFALSLIHI